MRSVSPHQGGISFQNFSSFPHPFTPLFSLNQPPTHIHTTLVPQNLQCVRFCDQILEGTTTVTPVPNMAQTSTQASARLQNAKKNFPVLVRSPLPLVYQSGEFLCFLLVFLFGHLILGSTSLGSVQNHMTFA